MTWLTKTLTTLDNTRTLFWLVVLVAASALPLTYVLLVPPEGHDRGRGC